jgi:hypothetical protein
MENNNYPDNDGGALYGFIDRLTNGVFNIINQETSRYGSISIKTDYMQISTNFQYVT